MKIRISLLFPFISIILTILFLSLPALIFADGVTSTAVLKLKVQNAFEPLTVEDARPTFSWQMKSDIRGQKQIAYRIVVIRNTDNSIVWNSGRIESGISTNIRYLGVALQPEMPYQWELTVWDKYDQPHQASSFFETGLMNPKLSAWKGAKFIGTKKPYLDAASHMYFEINTDFQLIKGDVVSLIFGANDFRLTDSFQNIDNLAGENYIRVDFDFSGTGTNKGVVMNLYRVGYAKLDSPDIPYLSISESTHPDSNINEIFTHANKNEKHNLQIHVENSNVSFIINDIDFKAQKSIQKQFSSGFSVGNVDMKVSQATKFPIGPYGHTHDFNAFPHLNSVGFSALPGSEVIYSDYKIKNRGQSVDNVVFNNELGKGYSIFEGFGNTTVSGNKIQVKNTSGKLELGYADPSHGALPMLRTRFNTDKKIAKAKLYATAMGGYDIFINGKKTGDAWFAPGASQFRETLGYHAYDVTEMLQEGENVMGAMLNQGWYRGYMTFTTSNFNFYGDHEALLAMLVIIFEDGSEEIVVTDPQTWRVFSDGPVRFGSFFQGERYDANKEAVVEGWASVNYDDSQWKDAEIIEPRNWIEFNIKARCDEPVRVREILTAQGNSKVSSSDKSTWTYDMGVNMVGVPEITIPAGILKKGDQVIIRYGEQLYPGLKGDKEEYVSRFGKKGKNIAGRILHATNRAAMNTDFYTAKNSDETSIRPSSTFRGYQYIQITLPDYQKPLPLNNVKGLVLSSDELPTGRYHATTRDGTTGNLVNQLFRNIQRSQLGNFFTIPTDCPQRNERMGWTGDAQAYCRTATYNADVLNFFRQWMAALRDDQGIGSKTEASGGIGSTVPTYNQTDDPTFANGTTWAAAVCMVPWQLYIQYGNTQVIEENIETMMNWLNGMDFYDFSDKYTYLSGKTGGLADWLAIDGRTPPDLVNNAIYLYMMEVTSIMAETIGKTDYAALLKDRHAKAKLEWNLVYVDSESGKTKDAKGNIIHSQTSYATPLNFNAFSDNNRHKAEAYLAQLAKNPSASGYSIPIDIEVSSREKSNSDADSEKQPGHPPYSITTGFSGTPNILPALSRGGYIDEAFKMISCTSFASWLYPVTKGAKSVWERWNSYDVAFSVPDANNMNSFNHFALGAVGQWMYEYQLGITTDHLNGKAGYKQFILQPSAGADFTSLEGSFESAYGEIRSSWTADGNGNMTSFKTTVPANTTAILYLPVLTGATKFEADSGVTFKEMLTHHNRQAAKFELNSGTYEFSISATVIKVK